MGLVPLRMWEEIAIIVMDAIALVDWRIEKNGIRG
jgi:hypothetical protein